MTSDSEDDEESPQVKQTKYSASNEQQPMADEIYSQFLNLGRKFMSKMENARERELMQRKTSKKSLDFDEMPQPPRDMLVCTPPRNSRDIIPASPDNCDFELDSFASQSSRSTLKRLQDKFSVIGSKTTSDSTLAQIQEWLNQTARAEMLKLGDYEDLRTKRETIGGFVPAHLSCSYFRTCVPMS